MNRPSYKELLFRVGKVLRQTLIKHTKRLHLNGIKCRETGNSIDTTKIPLPRVVQGYFCLR